MAFSGVFFLYYLYKKNFFPYLSRQVDSTDGENLAKLNDCAWIETSAKNNLNIGAFVLLPVFRILFFGYTFFLVSFFLSFFLSFFFLPTWNTDFFFVSLYVDRVFELCLQEIEKLYGPSQGDQPSKFGSCLIM